MGGGGGGFFSFIMPVVGAVIGSMIPGVGTVIGASVGAGIGGTAGGLMDGKDFGQSLLQGAVAGVGTFVGANYLAPVAGSAGVGASLTLGTAASAGAISGFAGGMVSGFFQGNPQVPDQQLPSFQNISYKDGLDSLQQSAVAAPTWDEATQTAAARKAAQTQEIGAADQVLTQTSNLGNLNVRTKALLGA